MTSATPAASGGGYVPGGVGWYRKAFQLPAEMHGKRVWIEFDGVYKNADVYLNGQHLGFHPYGYTSFYYDLTPHLHPDGHNVLAVRVDDSTLPDSRFFTGAGIYRHTWLSIMAPCHIAHWGAHACTPRIGPDSASRTGADYARVDVMVRVCNETAKERLCTLVTRIVDAEGQRGRTPVAPRHPRARRARHPPAPLCRPGPPVVAGRSLSVYCV